MLRVILVLALLAGGCTKPLAADASGEDVYTARCASCHGDRLQGGGGVLSPRGPGLGPGSVAAGRSDDYYLQTIRNGNGRMPPVRGLTEQQIDRVISFIRRVQGGA
ncbi:MAG TPA: cytochrome c [Acidimicrobiia bacterium]